ncbi:MAG: hypothetical protein ABGZ36_02625 [Actinomycetota bacterium]
MTTPPDHLFEGAITAAGFASGESVVVGSWARSPLGMCIDVMWRRPDGERILLAPRQEVADYIADLYAFDTVRVVPIEGRLLRDSLRVTAGPLQVSATLAARDWRSWLFALRPRALRRSPRWIAMEDRLARPFVGRIIGGGEGVRAAGIAPGGQQEFYGADDWRALTWASLTVGGEDAGPMAPLPADFGVGLSAFPTQPASVRVGTIIRPAPDRG